MQTGENRHASEELLEQYSMGRLAGSDLEWVESHLLVCAYCQDALASSDTYVMSIRSAARELRRQTAEVPQPWYGKLFDLPKPAWALGMAALALLIVAGAVGPWLHRAGAPPAIVVLQSTRGSALNSGAPAGKPLVLMLDLTDLQPLPQYKLEIVDTLGHPVFQSAAAPARNSLRAALAKGLPAGMYYVRLYAPGRELLREYGLKVLH